MSDKEMRTEGKGKEKDKTYDPWRVLEHPHLAEKSMGIVETENKLVFMVKMNADKEEIKEAVERGFNVKVEQVNVVITRKGAKKAYVKLHPDYSAADIATRLGML
jgi:large subunit ribosomal protein L23